MSQETNSNVQPLWIRNRPEMSVENSLAAHAKMLAEYWGDGWDELTSSEKAVAMNYKRQLESGAVISLKLQLKVNALYEKYEDFSMRKVP